MVLELMPLTTGITLAGYANRIQHLPFCVDMILQATANLLRLLMLFLSFFSLISSSKVAKEDDICHVYCAWAQVGRRPRALTVPLLPSKTWNRTDHKIYGSAPPRQKESSHILCHFLVFFRFPHQNDHSSVLISTELRCSLPDPVEHARSLLLKKIPFR